MTKRVQAQALYHLNFLQSIGYNYCEAVHFHERCADEINLPNDLKAVEQIAKNCHLCGLGKFRANVLFGEGKEQADLMFIGDEPSISEDEMDSFFVGRSGEMLKKMIQNAIGLDVSEVYMTNMVKCRTSNGVISAEEVNSCRAYLDKQIEIIKPKLIVLLGEVAFDLFVEDAFEFSKVRGQTVNFKGLNILGTFHPNYLLRNPSVKKEAYYDMLKIKAYLERV